MRTRQLSKRRNPTAARAKKGHSARFFRPLVEPLESRRLLSVGGGSSALVAGYGQIPMGFEPNVGQTDAQVQFLSRGNGYSLFLTSAEAVLRLQQPVSTSEATVKSPTPAAASAVLDVQLVGGNASPNAVGLDELPGKSNYLIGNDPSQWHTGIANYARVEYQKVYPGVDLAYYGNQDQLEYDFTVAPGANPKAIGLSFQGAASMGLDAQGNLVLHTSGGDVVEHAPVVYQEIDGAKQSVVGKYMLESDDHVGFQVGAYDANQPLVIDPVLVYSTYLGGSGNDSGYAIAVDNSGEAYVTGETTSVDFPGTHVLQPALRGATDAFIAKLNADGTELVYSTYLGAAGADNSTTYGSGIAVDDSGAAYVIGTTELGFWPNVSTAADGEPLQAEKEDGPAAFVAKLSADGTKLIYSSTLGGSDYLPSDKTAGQLTYGNGIAVGRDGSA